jgi:hypothetical protein
MVGVPVGLKGSTMRCALSDLAVDPLFPWGLRVQTSNGDGLTAVVKHLPDGQRLQAHPSPVFDRGV